MNAENIFIICNSLAALGWLLLIITPNLKLTRLVIIKGTLPLLLAIAYSIIVAVYFFNAAGNYNSLPGVMLLFQNKYIVLAGWLHYLAFDLLIGVWIVENARQHQLPHWYLFPALALTFMFGPAGFLLYLGTRKMFSRATTS